MNEFDTILRQIVQVIADDAISDYTKNEAIDTIKQAIEKHVIGEDVRTFYEPEDGNASEEDRIINDKLAEQRRKLRAK